VTGTANQTGSIAPRATMVVPSTVSDANTANNGAQLAITVNPIAPSTLVTSVPAPTYAAGSEQLAAFNYLNGIRGRCGFGLLKQDTRLDQAAGDHANYLAVNFAQLGAIGHVQTPGLPGFTGITVGDRTIARGYEGISTEGVIFGVPTASLQRFVAALLQTAYHSTAALGSPTDVGFGRQTLGASFVVVVYGTERNTVGQQMAGDAVALAPCDGERDWRRVHAPENPNPMPGVPLGTYGAALVAKVREGQLLSVDEWTLIGPGGAPVSTTLRRFGNDPNNNMAVNRAVLIPNVVLAPNTTYNVVLRGKNSGIPFERRYSFTTGAD
jgi:hypothetical protein